MRHTEIPRFTPSIFTEQYLQGFSVPGAVNGSNHHHIFGCYPIEDILPYFRLPVEPNRRTFYFMVMLTEGFGRWSWGLNKYDISAPTLCFMPSGQVSTIEMIDASTRGWYCMFDDHFFLDHGHSFALERLPYFAHTAYPMLHLKEEQASMLNAAFREIYTFGVGNGAESPFPATAETLAASLLRTLLLRAEILYGSEASPVPSVSAEALITKRFKDVLLQNIRTATTVSEYAALLHVTPSHLNRCVKRTSGQAASELIAEMAVLEAKVLLHQSEMSIADIADALRFEDSAYFSRFFKKNTGFTPTEYRQQNTR